MTAQPASSIPKWSGNYFFGNEALIGMPEYGSLVSAVIAGWSITEAHLGRSFAALIGAKQPITMTMYSAARSFEVQRDLVQAVVDEVLPRRYADLFRAALVVMGRAALHRHRFAHWVWGVSADPNLTALLLVEPKHLWNLTAAQIKHSKRHQRKIGEANQLLQMFEPNFPRLRHQDILVYRLNDLQDARGQVERAYRISVALRQLVDSKGARRRTIYHWLMSEADIRSAFEKARNSPLPKKPPRPPRRRKDPPKK